uniref:Metalloendopeptidase n=1 Tax=Caenorhabditis tropicalis TaxID=1561998 RepID=A0A1I7V522_9PELO
MLPIVFSVLLSTPLALCQAPFWMPNMEQFSFLTETDYRNALLLPTNTNTRRVRSLYHDMRIPMQFYQRFKRGGGVAVAAEKDKWPNGRVPYILSAAYTSAQRAVLARAFDAYAKRTCIRFVPKSPSDKDYIVIQKCYADFSRVGGRQQVSLADECIDYATIIHELMHVIGFIHEHQREDRDSYVSILYQNVIQGANTDFDKLSNLGLSYYGEHYDYTSIMHYEANEGSRNGKNTIEAKNAHFTGIMGKANDFSTSDLRRVNRAYKCSIFMF